MASSHPSELRRSVRRRQRVNTGRGLERTDETRRYVVHYLAGPPSMVTLCDKLGSRKPWALPNAPAESVQRVVEPEFPSGRGSAVGYCSTLEPRVVRARRCIDRRQLHDRRVHHLALRIGRCARIRIRGRLCRPLPAHHASRQ